MTYGDFGVDVDWKYEWKLLKQCGSDKRSMDRLGIVEPFLGIIHGRYCSMWTTVKGKVILYVTLKIFQREEISSKGGRSTAYHIEGGCPRFFIPMRCII